MGIYDPVTSIGQYVAYGQWGGTPSESDGFVDGKFYADGTPNVKGAWSTAVASTPFPVRHLSLTFEADYGPYPSLVDVAVGPVGSETLIVENLITVANGYGDAFPGAWQLPVAIPAGSRIALRSQTPNGYAGVYATVGIAPVDFRDPRIMGVFTTYGADTSASLGTNVDVAGPAKTFSPWVELTSATVRDHYELIVALVANDGDVVAPRAFRAQLGAGAAGSEAVIANELVVGGSQQTDRAGKNWRLPIAVPAGTRLAVRAACNVTIDGDRDLHAIVYGVS